jgi:hypothetical protein
MALSIEVRVFKSAQRLSELTVVDLVVFLIPLQALTGPEGSRRLKLPYFKIIGT